MVRQRIIKPQPDEITKERKPIPGLVPIANTGLYTTPDTPADPFDCDRYPDSPYCGGNPLRTQLAALNPNIVATSCDIGITLSPVLGYIAAPPISIVYRNPECREKEKPPVTPTDPFNISDGYIDGLEDLELFANDSDFYTVFVQFSNFLPMVRADGKDRSIAMSAWFTDISCPGYPSSNPDNINYYSYTFGYQVGGFNEDDEPVLDIYDTPFIGQINLGFGSGITLATFNEPVPSIGGIALIRCFGGSKQAIKTALFKIVDHKTITGHSISANIVAIYRNLTCEKLNPNRKNPPPRKPKKRCCMSCCPNNNDRPDEALMRQLLRRVNELHDKVGEKQDKPVTLFDGLREIRKFLGIDQMPAKLPKRLIKPKSTGDHEVKDLPGIFDFLIKQVDRAVGFLPQKIKIADINTVQAGNQSIELEINSMADFCRIMLQQIYDTNADTDAGNNMNVRQLYELGFIHQLSIQNHALLDAIVEHLDFTHSWKKTKAPFAFDPYAGTKKTLGFGKGSDAEKFGNTSGKGATTEKEVEDLLSALLQNTEVEIKIIENEEKLSLNDLLQEIRRNAAIAGAANSANSDGETLESLVAAAQVALQLQSAIDRRNMRQSLTSGKLTTRKKKS